MVSDWEIVTIGDLCTGIYDGPHATPKKTNEGPIFLGISSLSQGRIDLSSTEHLSEEDFAKWTRRVTPQAGDVVFSYETRLGEVGLIPEGLKCCLGRRMALMRPDPLKADSRFLMYAYLSPEFQDTIRARTIHGSTVDRIPLTEFPSFPIKVPPLDEQKSIAHILGTLDDKIELNQQMNRTLEAIARTLFKSWFIDFDPVRAKLDGRQPAGMDAETAALFPAGFEDSVLGQIPKGWKVRKLCEISSNESESFDFSCHPKVIFLNTGDIAWGQFLHANYSSKDGLPGQAKKAIRKNDILFSEIRPANGRYAFVDFAPTDYVVSTKFMVVRANNEIHPRLLYRVLTRPETLAELQVIADSRSGTFPQITFTSIGHLTFVLPPTPLQSAYQSFVEPLDRKSKVHDLETQNLSSIRDALLPKLLSGEIRVKEAEKIVAEVA